MRRCRVLKEAESARSEMPDGLYDMLHDALHQAS
jgi:hypothetical protein